MKRGLVYLGLALALFSGFLPGKAEPVAKTLGKIPVQSGGRVKPFESFSREALLSVTGNASWRGESASLVVWKWIAKPEAWYTQSILPVKFPPLRKELALKVIGGRVSPEIVLTDPIFSKEAEEALAKQERKQTLLPIDKKRIELYDRARLFLAVAQGALPGFIPHPEDPELAWLPLAALASPEDRAVLGHLYSASELADFQNALGELVLGIRGNQGDLDQRAGRFSALLFQFLESKGIALDQGKLRAELIYNGLRPFQWAWILYLFSATLWFFSKNRFKKVAFVLFLAAFFFHTFGFSLRCFIAGRPPVTNMYESVIWVAWGVVAFSLLLSFFFRSSTLQAQAAWVSAFALVIGESFPAVLDASLSPLVPVLRSNYWLTIHVLTITLSYGAFALAWGLAHANLMSFAFHPKRKAEQRELAEYVYRALQIGVLLLTAGTILGGVWANDSWGRFWGWDPKETWALIALLGYLVVLHGRYAGWLGDFGTAVGSIVAFLGVLMAWYGVNFVLAAGFHSYGFGGGGLPYVFAGVVADLAFVSYLAFRYNKSRRLVLS
jgi:cytochrome c-type biogenesis protein CcsB